MPMPTLVYFAARGRAELIRIVLAEAGVDYALEPVKELQPLKGTGRLPFDAVPVWEEPGGFRLAQSAAIANHLARAHGLRGRSARDEALIDQALGAVDDVRLELRKLVIAAPEQRAAVRAELLSSTLPRWIGYFDRLLRQNRDGQGHLVGEAVSIADLALWYLLEMIQDNGFGAALQGSPLLPAFLARIGARPKIAEYVRSPQRPPLVPLPG